MPDLPVGLIADVASHHLQRIADNHKRLGIDAINNLMGHLKNHNQSHFD